MNQRFTLDGSAELEARLAASCERVREALPKIIPERRLDAVLLGGGYGRGEGGVLRTASGDQPYNDLEFYVFMAGPAWLNQRRYLPALRNLGHELGGQAGIEVEFKIISLAKLRRSPSSMFYYDLLAGHQTVWGDDGFLTGCEQHWNPEAIPKSEATRLLMNRCTGLLLAQEKLQQERFGEGEADFIGRNQAKAQLALGDAVLTEQGQYHWSCITRHERLVKLENTWPWLTAVKQHHAAGVAFKLHPQKAVVNRGALEKTQTELKNLALQVWLWLESRRLGQEFLSASAYAGSPMNKCPETSGWRNFLINAAVFGGPAVVLHHRRWRYPRERLFESLALLLWEPAALKNPRLLQRLQEALRTPGTSDAEMLSAYKRLWQRFN